MLRQNLPEDGRHEAVDEEIQRWIGHQEQLGNVTAQKDPQWQIEAAVVQVLLVLFDGENLDRS